MADDIDAALQPGKLDGVLLCSVPDTLTYNATGTLRGSQPAKSMEDLLCSSIAMVLQRWADRARMGDPSPQPMFFMEDGGKLYERSEPLRKRLNGYSPISTTGNLWVVRGCVCVCLCV